MPERATQNKKALIALLINVMNPRLVYKFTYYKMGFAYQNDVSRLYFVSQTPGHYIHMNIIKYII